MNLPGGAPSLEVVPVTGLGEIRPGDPLAELIAGATGPLLDHDVVVVTSKIVSKAEGRLVRLDEDDTDGRTALVEAESRRILRRRGDLFITETPHGFVCANAGIDRSNLAPGEVPVQPRPPDRSARKLRDALAARWGLTRLGVVITDTFGRPWRRGVTDVALGTAGLAPVVDLRGAADSAGRPLEVTEIALADEIAAAADLVMGKTSGVPVAVVRGLTLSGDGAAADLVRPYSEDLFR